MNRPSPAALLDTDWVIHYLQDREPYASRIEELGLSRIGISAACSATIRTPGRRQLEFPILTQRLEGDNRT